MKLEDLRFFEKVAALGNVSAAGRAFGLSASAASSRLQGLEASVGSQLFSRTTRRISLTEAGEVLLAHSTNALAEIDEALEKLDELTQTPTGRLKVSSNVFFGRRHILPYMVEFREQHPDITLTMDFSDEIVDIVADGYDVAIRVAPLPDSTLKARRLGANRRVLCATPDYLERRGVPKTPADLSEHDCIGVSSFPYWYLQGPEGEVAYEFKATINGDNGDYSYDAVMSGLGIAIKSVAHVWEELRDGRLIELMTDYPVTRTGAVWAVYPPAKVTPPKVRAFIDFLLKKYGSPAYWES
ncbi:MAG: LysR family transcriptional regulator [Rhodobacteraceae bacterium]|nr:LysR family transcriptional regulator [Paracoccaceae bacterium]